MSGDTSYYAVVMHTVSSGPGGLIRRRALPQGGFTDEAYTRSGTWKPTDDVVRWRTRGDADLSLVLISEDEAEALRAWFGDRAGRPPLIGGRSLARVWSVVLSGPVPIDALIDRLDLLPHGSPADPGERDPAFRVLRNDESARHWLAVHRAGDDRWVVALEFLGAPPAEQTVRRVRGLVVAAAAELGFAAGDEGFFPAESSAMRPSMPRRPAPRRVLTLSYSGPLDPARLVALQDRLALGERDGQLDDEEETDFGERYLPNDGTFRARLWLARDDVERWTAGVTVEGALPTAERVDRWRKEIAAAAAEAGLTPAGEWRTPSLPSEAPLPGRPEPRPAGPVDRPVHQDYGVVLSGALTRTALDLVRDRLGLSRRGRLDDDWDEEFGVRALRDAPEAPMLLRLYRKSPQEWLIALTHQGEPPASALLEELRREIRAAAAEAGLTVERELGSR